MSAGLANRRTGVAEFDLLTLHLELNNHMISIGKYRPQYRERREHTTLRTWFSAATSPATNGRQSSTR